MHRFDTPVFRWRFGLISVGLAVLVVAAGCGSDADPRQPAGGYQLYRQAVLKGDVETMWKRSSPSTREYFQERYDQLVKMDREIRNYLPQTDHALARKQTGTELLDEVEGPRELFEKIVQPENMPLNRARRNGSEIAKIRMGKKGEVASVETEGGRKYRVVKGDDGEWYVDLVGSVDAVDASFQWLDDNRKALEKTVNDMVEKRREEREKIIADLMDVDEE